MQLTQQDQKLDEIVSSRSGSAYELILHIRDSTSTHDFFLLQPFGHTFINAETTTETLHAAGFTAVIDANRCVIQNDKGTIDRVGAAFKRCGVQHGITSSSREQIDAFIARSKAARNQYQRSAIFDRIGEACASSTTQFVDIEIDSEEEMIFRDVVQTETGLYIIGVRSPSRDRRIIQLTAKTA